MSTTREEWTAFVRAHAVSTVAERLDLQALELATLRREKAERHEALIRLQEKITDLNAMVTAFREHSLDLDELSVEALTAMARTLLGVHGDPTPEASSRAYEQIVREIQHRRQISDEEAVVSIHALLDGKSWTSDTTLRVADIVRETGRPIRDVSDVD